LRELRFLYDGNKKFHEDGTIDFDYLMVRVEDGTIDFEFP
jgi:hypothetical protein